MTINEAYTAFKSKVNRDDARHAIEYETKYVFVCGAPTVVDSGTYAVDKQSGVVTHFNPLNMPLEEYRSGKVVKDFK